MTRHEITEPRQLAFEGVHKLKLVTIAGKVDVVGTEAAVEPPGPPAGSDEGAGAHGVGGADGAAPKGAATVDVSRIAGREPVVVELIDGELTIRHGEFKPSLLGSLFGAKKIESDIAVSVPPDCVVDVSVVSGPLVVSNLHEQARVQGVSGEITLAQLHGPTDVRTVSGSITAECVTDDFSAHTMSGAITIIALGAASTIKAGTTSGAITVDLEEGTDKPRVDLNCVSGAVTVRLPADANMDVDMSTMNGRTVTTFPELGSEAMFGGRAPSFASPRKLSGTLGAGGGRLKARAVSGDMTVLRRTPNPDLIALEDGKDV